MEIWNNLNCGSHALQELTTGQTNFWGCTVHWI